MSALTERSVRRRRAVIGVGFLVMFLFALGIFLLPFAFPTEGAIVARFASVAAFSPNTPGGRATLPVSVEMRDPGTIRLLVTHGSKTVRTLFPRTNVRKGWTIVAWDGRNDRGVPVPDGTYTIQLSATSGRKGYNASRRAYVDRTRPPAPTLAVSSAGAGALPVGAQCVVSGTPAGYARFIFVVQHLPGGAVIYGPKFAAAGTSVEWAWNGRGLHGALLAPGFYPVTIETLSVNGFTSMAVRQCWIGNLLGTLVSKAVPGGVATVRLVTPAGIPLPAATPVRLQVVRRLGTPGVPGPSVGRAIGASVATTAAQARIRLPHGIPTADLWIEAHVGRRTALIATGARP